MIATRYNIYTWDNFNRLYLTNYGRFGETDNYTFIALTKEKCNLQITTSASTDLINRVELTIANYRFSYTMPTSNVLDIDISDVIAMNVYKTLRVNVRCYASNNLFEYDFSICVWRGYDGVRLLRLLNCEGPYTISNQGVVDAEFVAIPDEPLVPYDEENTRYFNQISFVESVVWSRYGASNVVVTQDGTTINASAGTPVFTQLQMSRVRPYRDWNIAVVGRTIKKCRTRATYKPILITGSCPLSVAYSATPRSAKFGFFLEIFSVENNNEIIKLNADATSLSYMVENEMRIKIGVRDISHNDFVLYSYFIKLCEDLKVFFDEQSVTSMARGAVQGYNARLASSDFEIVTGEERGDFIVELIIAY